MTGIRNPLKDTRQHFQGHHAGLIYNQQTDIRPLDRFQEVVVRTETQCAVDCPGLKAGAVSQILRRFTSRTAKDPSVFRWTVVHDRLDQGSLPRTCAAQDKRQTAGQCQLHGGALLSGQLNAVDQ